MDVLEEEGENLFYNLQYEEQKRDYKRMLAIVGNLTVLFSESSCPYLSYRAHENIFCKYFKAENLARSDCSVDAKKGKLGIGLKTWMGNDDQKIAEFGKLRETYKSLTGIELVKKISEYRNERIRITKNLYDIEKMIYHIVKRIPGSMQIIEYVFDYIDVNRISIIPHRGNANNTYFTDGKHIYHFSTSKNTLYMIFEDLKVLDQFEVEIMNDPFQYLMDISMSRENYKFYKKKIIDIDTSLCLRLYSTKSDGTKFVPEKSGLNQWNAAGRKRNPNEIYIPYPAEDRKRKKDFFPDRDTIFELQLPDGNIIPAKICQADGKAIMSNPNKLLGEWLLRKVFEVEENTVITYEMLERFGIDSVIFRRNGALNYSIDFAEIGTYEEFLEAL